jgi:hypothetical protein
MNNYYTYVYLDPRKPGIFEYNISKRKKVIFDHEPFYVGKGKNKRHVSHIYLKNSNYIHNTYLTNKINKIYKETNSLPTIIKVKENISEKYSLIIEKQLIKFIGRKDLNLGPLCNHTDGGEKGRNRIATIKQKTHKSLFKKGQTPWNKGLKYKQNKIEEFKPLKIKNIKERKSTPLLQYDLEGNFIKEWKNTNEAVKNGYKNLFNMFHKKSNYSLKFQWFKKDLFAENISLKINKFVISKNSPVKFLL